MVNLDELRKKYESIKNSQSNKGNFDEKYFRIEKGVSQVRILPWKDSDKDFYFESAVHYIDEKSFHCPRVLGKDCPVCDLYYKLWKIKGPVEEDAQKLARSIKPQKRYYMNVVDRKSGTVKILSVGVKLFENILGCFFDEDYGDLTDLKNGWDFKIVKEFNGQYPTYDRSAPKPKQTPAGTDKEIAEWMDSLHDIHNLVSFPEYEELKAIADTLESTLITSNFGEDGSSSQEGSESFSDEDFIESLRELS